MNLPRFEAMTERLARPREWECPDHGPYGEGIPNPCAMSWTCPACERIAQQAKREFDSSHSRYAHWVANSGVPRRNLCVTPSHILGHNPSTKAMAKAVQAYLGNLEERMAAGQGLILLGPPGLGITLALTAIVNAVCRDVRNATYVVWPDVLADLKAGFNGDRNDERRSAVSRLKDTWLLAIDELGVKTASEFDQAELFGLIDYRYRNNKPTLVAANTTQDVFAQTVGERVADRLLEMGPVIVLSGQSLRGKHPLEGGPAFERPANFIFQRVHRQGEWRVSEAHAPDSFVNGRRVL